MSHLKPIYERIKQKSLNGIDPLHAKLEQIFHSILYSNDITDISPIFEDFNINPAIPGEVIDIYNDFLMVDGYLNEIFSYTIKITGENGIHKENERNSILSSIDRGIEKGIYLEMSENNAIFIKTPLFLFVQVRERPLNESKIEDTIKINTLDYQLYSIVFFRKYIKSGHVFIAIRDKFGFYQCNDSEICSVKHPLQKLFDSDIISYVCYVKDKELILDRNQNIFNHRISRLENEQESDSINDTKFEYPKKPASIDVIHPSISIFEWINFCSIFDKIIIYCSDFLLDSIYATAKRLKISFLSVDGKTRISTRNAKINNFLNSEILYLIVTKEVVPSLPDIPIKLICILNSYMCENDTYDMMTRLTRKKYKVHFIIYNDFDVNEYYSTSFKRSAMSSNIAVSSLKDEKHWYFSVTCVKEEERIQQNQRLCFKKYENLKRNMIIFGNKIKCLHPIANTVFPDCRNLDNSNLILKDEIRLLLIERICHNCGSVVYKGEKICCNLKNKFKSKENCNVRKIIPSNPPQEIINDLSNLLLSNANAAREINKYLSPIIQYANIGKSIPKCGFIQMTGTPYALYSKIGRDSVYQYLHINYRPSPKDFMETFEDNVKVVHIVELMIEILKSNGFILNNLPYKATNYGDATISLNDDTSDTVSILRINEEAPLVESRKAIYKLDRKYIEVESYKLLYDKLTYPLIFFDKNSGIGTDSICISLAKQARILFMQDNRTCWFHKLKLLREAYVVDIYGRIQDNKLSYLLKCMPSLIKENEAKKLEAGEELSNDDEGSKSFLPSSFIGSNNYWNNLCHCACDLAARIGPPSFFLTITMNPYNYDSYGLITPSDDYNLDSISISRIFEIKLKVFIDWMTRQEILGEIKAIVYRIEYQMRGLPHVHFLIWSSVDTDNTDEIDKYICTEYPVECYEKSKQQFYADQSIMISTYQLHKHSKRCGGSDNHCCYHYPQDISEKTTISLKSVTYMRRKEKDRLVVPFNIPILWYWRSHMDIEAIPSSNAIHYVLKYVSKQSDIVSSTVKIQKPMYKGLEVNKKDEIRYYAATRVISAPEAVLSIFGCWKYHIKPTIMKLVVHEEGKKIIYKCGDNDPKYLKKLNSLSKLERYFRRPAHSLFDNLTYISYYEKYSVKPCNRNIRLGEYLDQGDLTGSNTCIISRRKENSCYAFIDLLNPSAGERFYLRLLLINCPSRSYDDLKKNDKGEKVYQSFRESAISKGLIESDNEPNFVMNEAVSFFRTPSQIRKLYTILVREGASAKSLFENFYEHMVDEKVSASDIDTTKENLLQLLKKDLISIGIKITDIDLEMGSDGYSTELDILINNSKPFQTEAEILQNLNASQKSITLNITKKLLNGKSQMIYLQGRAGTGKTYTVNVIINLLNFYNYLVIPCGSTGIAASMYKGGTTIHSLFKIGIDENSSANFCNIGKNSQRAELLRNVNVLIFDEASMITYELLNKVNFSLRTLRDSDSLFGDVNILLVGDFLQLPPVSVKNPPIPVFDRLILSSDYWDQVKSYALVSQVRTNNKLWSSFLDEIAFNRIQTYKLWSLIPGITITKSVDEAIRFYLKDVDLTLPFPLDNIWIAGTNRQVKEINDMIQSMKNSMNINKIESIARNEIPPTSENTILMNNTAWKKVKKHLDFVEKPNIPSSRLLLMRGDPVFLIRNYDKNKSLVNGKRGHIIDFTNSGRVVNFHYPAIGGNSETLIPKICFKTNLDGITYLRYQLPFRIGYAGTVHRVQGLTMKRIIIDVRSNFWEHGQLYVALSRIQDPKNVCVLLPNSDENIEEMNIMPECDQNVADFVKNIESSCE